MELEGRALEGQRGAVGGNILSAAGTYVLPIIKAAFAKEVNLLTHCVDYARGLIELWMAKDPPDGWVLPDNEEVDQPMKLLRRFCNGDGAPCATLRKSGDPWNLGPFHVMHALINTVGLQHVATVLKGLMDLIPGRTEPGQQDYATSSGDPRQAQQLWPQVPEPWILHPKP